MIYYVIIIGAGPAGLFAAANIKNKKVLIIEKNKTAGKKLLLSGAGQCNYTNNCEINEFFQKYGDKGRFIKTALYNFTNHDSMYFFKEKGLNSIIREDKKVFPNTFKAMDVLNVLIDCVKHTEMLFNTSAERVSYDEIKKVFYVKTDTANFTCRNLIIASGGKSYPNTGATGDGYKFAKSLGHSIVDTKPALTPKNNKKAKEFTGDFLFTHVNISGPVIINNSRYMDAGDILKVNFTSFNEDEFKVYFEKLILSSSKLSIKTALKQLNLPKRFVEKILEIADVDENLSCSLLNKSSRKYLIELLSMHSFKIKKLGDYNVAMSTKGGVSTVEINQKTMESKKIPRLYFAGEVLDYDGDTGGFNIQGAFSTAKLAADQINKA